MLSKYSRIFLLLIISNGAVADTDIDNSNLAKLASELDFLMNRVDQIEREASKTSKTKFHYSLLKHDLKLIKMGINDHIQKNLSSSRKIESLSIHYHGVQK